MTLSYTTLTDVTETSLGMKVWVAHGWDRDDLGPGIPVPRNLIDECARDGPHSNSVIIREFSGDGFGGSLAAK